MSEGIFVVGNTELEVLLAVLTILFAVNGYFVKRLVSRIDNLDHSVTKNLPVYEQQIKTLSNQIEELKAEIGKMAQTAKELSDLKAQIAVLQFAYNQLTGKPPHGIPDRP